VAASQLLEYKRRQLPNAVAQDIFSCPSLLNRNCLYELFRVAFLLQFIAKMRPNLTLQIPYSPPGADAVSVSSPTYTPLSERRRSLLSIAGSLHSLNSLGSLNSLKQSKNKIQRYWPGSKSPGIREDVKVWNNTDTACDEQAAHSRAYYAHWANASRPRDRDDPKVKESLEQTVPRSVTNSSKQIHRKPVPPGMRPIPGLPAPQRAPPPPPIPELSAVNFHHQDGLPRDHYEMSASYDTEVSPFKRRAKTPVHRIGQLEMAALQQNRVCHNMDGINRMSSVSTIARGYRGLVEEYPESPVIEPVYPRQTDTFSPDSDGGFVFDQQLQVAAFPSPPTHHARVSSVSDDETLLGSEPDTTIPKRPSSSSSSDTPPKCLEYFHDEANQIAPSSLSFQIGLQLLTKELSAALVDRGHTDDQASAGLQVWVMIEAYERLRDQLEASGSDQTKEVRLAIDPWLKALYAIHNEIACDGAMADSDYESG
jgi:hypothetical protein